jgi:hypothetical protein
MWKPTYIYGDIYEVEESGTVRRKAGCIQDKNGRIVPVKARIMTQTLRAGYLCVAMAKDNAKKAPGIHQLVANAFIPNPNNYECINHKDGNKLNNSVDNLEWCTRAENNKHAYATGLRVVSEKNRQQMIDLGNKYGAINGKKAGYKNIVKAQEASRKRVAIWKDDFYQEFESEWAACRFIGAAKGSVGRVAHGKPLYNAVKGYKAKWIESV